MVTWASTWWSYPIRIKVLGQLQAKVRGDKIPGGEPENKLPCWSQFNASYHNTSTMSIQHYPMFCITPSTQKAPEVYTQGLLSSSTETHQLFCNTRPQREEVKNLPALHGREKFTDNLPLATWITHETGRQKQVSFNLGSGSGKPCSVWVFPAKNDLICDLARTQLKSATGHKWSMAWFVFYAKGLPLG